MTIREATPGAASVTELFAAGMTANDSTAEPLAPPEVDRDAPHGRNPETGEPLAPHGWTIPQRKGEQPRPKLREGRPSNDRARVADSVPAGAEAKPKSGKAKGKVAARIPEQDGDYSDALAEFGDAIWLGLSGLSMVGEKLPLIGKRLPAKKLAAEAAIFRMHQPRLAATVALAAQHNPSAARFCNKLSAGGPTWVLTAGSMLLPFFAHTRAVLSGDEALAGFDTSLEQLADSNEAAVKAYFGEVAEALGHEAAA